MKPIEREGRKRTLFLFASILYLSIHTIFSYHYYNGGIETAKLIQQIIRFGLTIGLMAMVLNGINWSRIVLSVLLGLASILAVTALFTPSPFIMKIPFIMMILVYGSTTYYLNFSTAFKEYFNYCKYKTYR